MMAAALTKEQVAALKALQRVWSKEQIVLIGASALGCFIDMRWRQTHDLDFSVSISIEEHASCLEVLSGWRRDASFEQRWIAPGEVRIDIIPAGPKLLAAGEVIWPKTGNRLSLVGLRLAFENSDRHRIDDELELRVARVPAIAVLKMIAYLERPVDRVRDLSDLAYMLEEFLSEDDPRRFSDETFQLGLAYEETSAFFLGKEIGHMVNEIERRRVTSFVAVVRDESDPNLTQTRMLLSSPASWQKDQHVLLGRLNVFERGLNIGSSDG